MKNQMIRLAQTAAMALSVVQSAAFSTAPRPATFTWTRAPVVPHSSSLLPLSPSMKTTAWTLYATSEETDEEIERLRSMAARLRAEAAELEAQQQQAMAVAAENAFRKFDTDQDGEISLQELKSGLEKAFKMELSEKRVKQLLADFDKNNDGALQLDEFVSVDRLRNRLDSLARDEKALALERVKAAQMEKEAVKLLQAQLEMINDKAPSNTDKILSTLPYLFPLLDGLQFAKYLVLENLDNPLSVVVGVIYAFYRSIPFSGLACFFALNFLSGNPRINRLVRFNMQQAIFLDIAIFFPGLIGALVQLISPGTIPPAIDELGSDITFGVLLIAVCYCVVSSLLGQEPDKLPLISSAVQNRMPTVDMFDSQGRFIPRDQRKKKKEDEEKKKDD